MIPETDMDYVEFYAARLSEDRSIFSQQKKLIESQLRSSSDLFKKMFGAKDFEKKARNYLRKIGLIKPLQ